MSKKKRTMDMVGETKWDILNVRNKGNHNLALDKIAQLVLELTLIVEEKRKGCKLYNRAQLALGWAMHQEGVTLQGMKADKALVLASLWKAFAFRKAIGDNVGMAYTIFQIAMCHEVYVDSDEEILFHFQRARPYILCVIEENEGLSLKKLKVETLGNMYHNYAYICQKEGKISAAIDTYQKAFDCRCKADDNRGAGLTLARLAECYSVKEGLTEEDLLVAFSHAKDAFSIFQKIGDMRRMDQVNWTLHKIKEKMKEKGMIECICGWWIILGTGIGECTKCGALWEP